MPEPERSDEQAVRETAYFIWEQEGRPHGRAEDHWVRAVGEGSAEPARADEPMEDEEKVLAGRLDVNMPALLTKDVPGG
jgi:Protein of unknown function (DUF2934)